MVIEKSILKIGLLITVAQFLLASGCKKNGTTPCIFGGCSFAVTSEWSPQKEIYNIGDTLFLTSIFPKTLTDQINPAIVVDYSNSVGIGEDVGIALLDTITHQPIPARDSFLTISVIGNFLERDFNKNQGINTMYAETAQNYQFIGGHICRKKGIYGISVSNLKSVGARGINCTNAGFSMSVTNSNKHINLYQFALNSNPDAYGLQRMYCFRVQ